MQFHLYTDTWNLRRLSLRLLFVYFLDYVFILIFFMYYLFNLNMSLCARLNRKARYETITALMTVLQFTS